MGKIYFFGYDKDISHARIECLCMKKTFYCVEKSNGRMAQMQSCNHVYHIKCLIDYVSANAMKCPECNDDFKDCRLSLAVAYNHGDTQAFIEVLGGFE